MRTTELIRPALNPKAALAGVGLVAACLAGCAQAPTAAVHKQTLAIVNFRSCGKPHYPAEDLWARHEGKVTLAFLVSTDGTVEDSKVLNSSGYRTLDEAALTAIATCQFIPATMDGLPQKTWANVQYVWTLR